MFALFLKLIEQLKALAERKETSNRKLFEDFIDPLYQSVLSIYEKASESSKRVNAFAKRKLTPTRQDIPEIVDILEEDFRVFGNHFQQLHDSIAAMPVDTVYYDFMKSILAWIMVADDPVVTESLAKNRANWDNIDHDAPDYMEQYCAKLIESMKCEQAKDDRYFKRITKDYERLKVALLLPKDIVKRTSRKKAR